MISAILYFYLFLILVLGVLVFILDPEDLS